MLKICADGIAELKKEKSRDDYMEFLQLSQLYLFSQDQTEGFFFRRPGALHKARWMSKLLYTLKMDLLSQKICDELPRGTVFGVSQREKIHRFAQFAVYCYLPWRTRSRNAASAPFNDLELLQLVEV